MKNDNINDLLKINKNYYTYKIKTADAICIFYCNIDLYTNEERNKICNNLYKKAKQYGLLKQFIEIEKYIQGVIL